MRRSRALVTAASRSVYAALSRPSLLPRSFTETIDLETSRITLRHWPVLQVTSVTWRGIAVPPDENADLEASVGYVLEPGDDVPPGRPQALDLFGHQYRPGRQKSRRILQRRICSPKRGANRSRRRSLPALGVFALRTLGIGSRRDLHCNRRALDAGLQPRRLPGNMRSAPGPISSPRRTPGNRFRSLTATCRRISRRRPWNWRLNVFARPNASGSSRSRSAVRKRSPTTRAQCRRRSKRCCNPISGSRSDVRARARGSRGNKRAAQRLSGRIASGAQRQGGRTRGGARRPGQERQACRRLC